MAVICKRVQEYVECAPLPPETLSSSWCIVNIGRKFWRGMGKSGAICVFVYISVLDGCGGGFPAPHLCRRGSRELLFRQSNR